MNAGGGKSLSVNNFEPFSRPLSCQEPTRPERKRNSNDAEAGLKLPWYPVINNDSREAEAIKTILQTHHLRAGKSFSFWEAILILILAEVRILMKMCGEGVCWCFKPALAYLHSRSSITVLRNYETTQIIVRKHCYLPVTIHHSPARQSARPPFMFHALQSIRRFVFEDFFVRKPGSLSLALPAYRTMKLFQRGR